MAFFLKTPHWGLFLLLVVFPIIGFPFTIFGIFLGSLLFLSLIYFLFVFGPLALFVCWLFFSGQLLYQRLDPADKQKMNFNLFRFNFFYTLLYIVLVYILAFVMFSDGIVSSILFLPLNLYVIFCLFYGYYFVSRTLAIVKKKGANFGDYIGYFFQVLFFPIGVWSIQPKINGLYRDMN